MGRVYNFSAGPAVLPESVLREAAEEMLDYRGCGMSVMEMSHRSSAFKAIIEEAEADLRDLMGIPDNYKVLFLQGGGSTQFAMVPLNLMRGGFAEYIVSGSWSKKAYQEAKRFGDAHILGDSSDDNFSYVPNVAELQVNPGADYVYICENETIYGTKYHALPETGDVPLVSDVSSCFLSEPIDVAKYGLIYGGAQKNVSPAGVTFAIVRTDALGKVDRKIPTMLNYETHIKKGSMFNTPPVLPIYSALQTLKWYKSLGGVKVLQKMDEEKAAVLYDAIDSSKMFVGTVREDSRSIMNVCFVMKPEYKELEKDFIDFAGTKGIVGIKGHRSVGGFRASLYNALPLESVKVLVEAMKEFENK